MKHIVICLSFIALFLNLVGCDKKKETKGSGPQPVPWFKTDVCSTLSPYNHYGRWKNAQPVFRFDTSLPIAYRSYAEWSASTWNYVGAKYQIYVNRDPISSGAIRDGQNNIVFSSLAYERLGETRIWKDGSGYIVEADIVINSTKPWSYNGSESTYDILSVLTHEFGHFCGLDHVNDSTQTMYPYTPLNSSIYQTLCSGDRLGLLRLYP